MRPTLFGLAEKDDSGAPDPRRVPIWGMQMSARAIVYWREDGKSRFAVFGSADRAASRLGPLFDLVLLWPDDDEA